MRAATRTAKARAAIDAMNRFYNQTDGRWSTSDAWWLSRNAPRDHPGLAGRRIQEYRWIWPAYLRAATSTAHGIPKAAGISEQTPPTTLDGESTGDGTLLHSHGRRRAVSGASRERDEAYICDYWSDDACDRGVIWNIPSLSCKERDQQRGLYLSRSPSSCAEIARRGTPRISPEAHWPRERWVPMHPA